MDREIDANRSAGQQAERDEERKEERGREKERRNSAVTEGTRNSPLQPQQEQERSKTIAE